MQAQPANAAAAARALAGLADDIWHAAGDTSTDYNWCGAGLLQAVHACAWMLILTCRDVSLWTRAPSQYWIVFWDM